MTDGDLFAEHTTIKLVLIDGQRVNFDAAETPKADEGEAASSWRGSSTAR